MYTYNDDNIHSEREEKLDKKSYSCDLNTKFLCCFVHSNSCLCLFVCVCARNAKAEKKEKFVSNKNVFAIYHVYEPGVRERVRDRIVLCCSKTLALYIHVFARDVALS